MVPMAVTTVNQWVYLIIQQRPNPITAASGKEPTEVERPHLYIVNIQKLATSLCLSGTAGLGEENNCKVVLVADNITGGCLSLGWSHSLLHLVSLISIGS